MLMRHYEIF